LPATSCSWKRGRGRRRTTSWSPAWTTSDAEILRAGRRGVRLEPANPKYKFIRPKHSLEIGGDRAGRDPQVLTRGLECRGPSAGPRRGWRGRHGHDFAAIWRAGPA
jgi:hypothetical protein